MHFPSKMFAHWVTVENFTLCHWYSHKVHGSFNIAQSTHCSSIQEVMGAPSINKDVYYLHPHLPCSPHCLITSDTDEGMDWNHRAQIIFMPLYTSYLLLIVFTLYFYQNNLFSQTFMLRAVFIFIRKTMPLCLSFLNFLIDSSLHCLFHGSPKSEGVIFFGVGNNPAYLSTSFSVFPNSTIPDALELQLHLIEI